MNFDGDETPYSTQDLNSSRRTLRSSFKKMDINPPALNFDSPPSPAVLIEEMTEDTKDDSR